MLAGLIAAVGALAAAAGQNAVQWLQSPAGQEFLRHLGHHLAAELSKHFGL